MPAILLRNSIFIHIPKTGGTWVSQVLREAVPKHKVLRESLHPTFLDLRIRYPKMPIFGFVRHPLSWWQSNWSHKVRGGWKEKSLLNAFRSDDFSTFMQSVIRFFPGYCTEFFEQFTGPENKPIDFVGKHENLSGDLSRALELFNESFDKGVLETLPPQNVGLNVERATYSTELEHFVLSSEWEALRRYGYETEPTSDRMPFRPRDERNCATHSLQ